jgi:vacuolar-type H+-ATPase subunit E/Vma4
MSCRELIDSLKKAAEERNRQIWKDAEAEAARVRSEAANKLDSLRAETAGTQSAMARTLLAQSISQAQNRARIIRLSAEKEVSARLYAAALSSLPALRKRSYDAVFMKLARELPQLDWQSVRVHPDDVPLARKLFPSVEIVADASITGGLDVSTLDGAIRIVNTFEKRLERAWGEIQPALIRDVYCEVYDGSASASAGPGISARIPAVKDQGEEVAADHGLETVDL